MSFVAKILESAAKRGTRPLLIEVHGARQIPTTGQGLLAEVARARTYLRSKGISPGDRVALLGPNAARWAAADIAIMAQGAICVPLYARQDPKQLGAMLQDAEARLLVAADDTLAQTIVAHLPAGCELARYDEVFAGEAQAQPPAHEAGSEPVTIIYTSGTSGEPKGVVLSADNVDFMLDIVIERIARMTPAQRDEDRMFHYLPLCFAGSRIVLWSQLQRPNPLWMSTDLNNLQQELQTAQPHYFLNVPVLLERIKAGVERKLQERGALLYGLYTRAVAAADKPFDKRTAAERLSLWVGQRVLFPGIKRQIGQNLEFLICGSAPLSAETQRWFERLGLPVYQVYGLTETTGIVTIDDTANVIPGRVGHAVAGCELRLSESGELLCRGPNVFSGYWRRPEASAEVLRDGYFHTGDQVELDANGSVRIIGRVKDVIVPESGHNVAPAPIEEKLQAAAPGIDQIVIVGHGRPFLAALVAGSISPEALDAARERVNAELPHYQRVRKARLLPEALSADNGLLTANQKLRRSAIEQHYRSTIEEMYQ